MTLADSTVSGNQVIGSAGSSNYPGAVGAGGGILVEGPPVGGGQAAGTVIGCTISNNSATGGTGGQGTAGGDGVSGGIDVEQGAPLALINTTITNNQATGGAASAGAAGGQGIGGGIDAGTGVILGNKTDSSTLNLTNCTISGNAASSAAGAAQQGRGGGISISGGQAFLFNTISAANSDIASGGGSSPDDVNGAMGASSDYNLIGAGFITSMLNAGNHNQIGTPASPIDAMLGALADNGGPTKTMALLTGSPAIDAGSNALAVGADPGAPGRSARLLSHR